MATMTFLVKPVRDHLSQHGIVYTIRSYQVKWLSDVMVPLVGRCRREYIGEVLSPVELIPYVNHSGFATVAEWYAKADSEFIHGRKMYLYKVIKQKGA